MKWTVGARGANGTLFVYTTEGPSDSTAMDAKLEVYSAHGRALRSGVQVEPLGPFSEAVSETDMVDGCVDGMPVGQWLEAMLMD